MPARNQSSRGLAHNMASEKHRLWLFQFVLDLTWWPPITPRAGYECHNMYVNFSVALPNFADPVFDNRMRYRLDLNNGADTQDASSLSKAK